MNRTKSEHNPECISIHQKALALSSQHKKTEILLIEILEQIEKKKVYLALGYSSLFQYVVQGLELSEGQAYNLITVMRKAKAVPALKEKIKSGEVNISNARRVATVLTQENQTEWLMKASTLSQRALEKEIAKVKPATLTPERIKYVTESRMKLEIGLEETEIKKLKQAQNLLSQAQSKAASLEETIMELTEFYLKHKDPIKKAERVMMQKQKLLIQKSPAQKLTAEENNESGNRRTAPKGGGAAKNPAIAKNKSVIESIEKTNNINTKLVSSQAQAKKREPISAHLIHQINLRDQRQCTYKNQHGKHCNHTRWLEVHHKTPVSLGGSNTLENLITLCSAHHDWVHEQREDPGELIIWM